MADSAGIGKQLQTLRKRLDEASRRTRSKKRKLKLLSQMSAIDNQVLRLIDGVVKKNSAQYRSAVESLKKANGQMKKALRDLKKLADAVEFVAGAISTVAALAV